MLRSFVSCTSHSWGDKLMSVLQARQVEECQARLSDSPSQGIFQDICQDDYQRLYRLSYYAKENKGAPIPDIKTLRSRVTTSLPRECAFLTIPELLLIEKMLTHGGNASLDFTCEISAAEALVCRLWCTVHVLDENNAEIHLQHDLLPLMLLSLAQADCTAYRELLATAEQTFDSLLYLHGFTYADPAVDQIVESMQDIDPEEARRLTLRFIRAGFDYLETAQGFLILLHPGLADVQPFLDMMTLDGFDVPVSRDMVIGAAEGLLPEERLPFQILQGALHNVIQPEFDEEDVLQDLLIMAKQGASLSEMREVLDGTLSILPTPRILSALEQLHLQAVRWLCAPSAVLN